MTGVLAVPYLALIALGIHSGSNTTASVDHDQAPAGEPPVCFVVVSNEAYDASSRDLRLLIRKDDATEANFVALLQYFLNHYPDAEHLQVSCETSLRFLLGNYLRASDIDAIRDAAEGRVGQYKPKVWEQDAQAVLEKEGVTVRIRYKLEGGDLRDLKCVQFMPRDPASPDCGLSEYEALGRQARGALQATRDGGLPCYFSIGNREGNGGRFIALLINEADGSVENLLALLNGLAHEHPRSRLTVRVLTSLTQVHDPFGPGMKEHFAAVLFRDGWNEVIRYRHPHEEETTVVVRGTDTFPGLDDATGSLGYPWMPSSQWAMLARRGKF